MPRLTERGRSVLSLVVLAIYAVGVLVTAHWLDPLILQP